jgi:hypothetical protein
MKFNADHKARPAVTDDLAALEALLFEAFTGDPFNDWLFPDESSRTRLMHENIRIQLEFLLQHGVLLTNSQRSMIFGCQPPGTLMDAAIYVPYRNDLARSAGESRERLELARSALADGPDLPSVNFLAVSGESRRTRAAISIMRHLYEALIEDGLRLFGHATSRQSLALYKRAGATLRSSPIALPLNGPIVYPVVWSPTDALPHYALAGNVG